MTRKPPVRWSSRPPAEWCKLARDAGDLGLAVTTAAQYIGISDRRFRMWERERPEFGEAAQKIRENSARLLLSRTEKLLAKSEERLLAALDHVRAKKREERQRVEAAMAQGLVWTPEQLEAKIQNLRELRADARREERERQKPQYGPVGPRRRAPKRVTVQTTTF
jgi:hypothetical protein